MFNAKTRAQLVSPTTITTLGKQENQDIWSALQLQASERKDVNKATRTGKYRGVRLLQRAGKPNIKNDNKSMRGNTVGKTGGRKQHQQVSDAGRSQKEHGEILTGGELATRTKIGPIKGVMQRTIYYITGLFSKDKCTVEEIILNQGGRVAWTYTDDTQQLILRGKPAKDNIAKSHQYGTHQVTMTK